MCWTSSSIQQLTLIELKGARMVSITPTSSTMTEGMVLGFRSRYVVSTYRVSEFDSTLPRSAGRCSGSRRSEHR